MLRVVTFLVTSLAKQTTHFWSSYSRVNVAQIVLTLRQVVVTVGGLAM